MIYIGEPDSNCICPTNHEVSTKIFKDIESEIVSKEIKKEMNNNDKINGFITKYPKKY